MTNTETSPAQIINIESLAFTNGAHLLLKKALRELPAGARLGVRGTAPELAVHLRGWCRAQGYEFLADETGNVTAWITRGAATNGRWKEAALTGTTDPAKLDAVRDAPSLQWGFAARGATVEAGGPVFHYPLHEKHQVWADNAPKLYAQAVAAQWNPNTAIHWDAPFVLAEDVENAVVQVMTYLIENENAALQVPAKFIAHVHPHFREVLQLLAIQIADEARHIEVFTRRATLRGKPLDYPRSAGNNHSRRYWMNRTSHWLRFCFRYWVKARS